MIAALREERVTLSSLEAIETLSDEIGDEVALFERIAGKSFAQVKEEVTRERPSAAKRESVRREFVKSESSKEADLFAANVEGDAAPIADSAPAIQERVTVTLSLTPEEFAIIEHARAIASRKPGRVPTVREKTFGTRRRRSSDAEAGASSRSGESGGIPLGEP